MVKRHRRTVAGEWFPYGASPILPADLKPLIFHVHVSGFATTFTPPREPSPRHVHDGTLCQAITGTGSGCSG